jgi:acyl-CoA thioesterase-2
VVNCHAVRVATPDLFDLPTYELLALEDGSTPTSFRLPIRQELCTPVEFLYGGSGIAACVEASERATGRPLQWITTQFLGSPTPGSVADIEVNLAVTGRATSQTQVTASVDGNVVFTSLCAHNVRPPGDERAFSEMPAVPSPHDSPPFADLFEKIEKRSFFDHFERRTAAGNFAAGADGKPQTGLLAMWCRLDGASIGSAATQGFVADLGPLAVCAALGLPVGGTSLDNTLRVVGQRAAGQMPVSTGLIGVPSSRSDRRRLPRLSGAKRVPSVVAASISSMFHQRNSWSRSSRSCSHVMPGVGSKRESTGTRWYWSR